jgi:hypothetical protein
MTLNELIIKLEECRYNTEGKDQDTFDTLNEIIYNLDKGRLEC